MKNNSPIYKKLISEQNIYNAIYSLESFVFEKELLEESVTVKDISLFNELSDKYNTVLIKSVIKECQEIIIDKMNTDTLFEISVFLKPKKFDSKTNKLEYRPIHTADLKTQICIVAMLNMIMFDDSEGTRKLSDISKLLPSNFYGNIPSDNVETLFKPWGKQYQDYSKSVIEANKEHFYSKTFKHEVNLDIMKFYPSIDPNFIYSFIISKLPIKNNIYDKECFDIILKKLLFFNVNNIENCLDFYYPNEKDKEKENLAKIKKKQFRFSLGIPQGLPQAYFFGNLCMIEIEKVINLKIKGDAYYYVDDSIIFTNIEGGDDLNVLRNFDNSIKEINKQIHNKLKPEKKISVNEDYIEFQKLINYKVDIYNAVGKDSKSKINEITPGDSLFNIAKPASTLTFQIKASFDELEDETLEKKIEAILDTVNYKLDELEKSNDKLTNEVTTLKKEGNIKLLKRYKKFYRYRLKILNQRGENEITEEYFKTFTDFFGLDPINNNNFFNRLEDDIMLFEAQRILKQSNNEDQKNKLVNSIINFENKLCDSKLQNIYYSKVIKNYKLHLEFKRNKYKSLDEKSQKVISSFVRVRPEKKIEAIHLLLSIINGNTKNNLNNQGLIELITEYKTNDIFKFIYDNSATFKRILYNALFSRILNVPINENCSFSKFDNRAIDYTELRLLMYLRSYNFEIDKFIVFAANLLKNNVEFSEKIDLTLFEVLPIFNKYIKDAQKTDELIQAHKYVNGIWKNGSKFLHFYTLHNEEHSVELIKQCTSITKSIDSLSSLKHFDYYLLFLSCYFHDISMVIYPNINFFTNDNINTDLIYTKWKDYYNENIIDKFTDIELTPKSEIKKFILDHYIQVNDYFEKEIREKHPRKSSDFIKKQSDLFFLTELVRKFVSEISESHGYEFKDVYGLRSKANNDILSEKYLMIVLRLADLLDMSKDRVSVNVLRQNIKHMPKLSKYHWISHMAVDKCTLKTHFEVENNGKDKIKEKVIIGIYSNTSLLTKTKSDKCTTKNCQYIDKGNNERSFLQISINTNDDNLKLECKNCNFMCKWMSNKHKYLFDELFELQQYLHRNSINAVFDTKFEVHLFCENTTKLPSDYLDVIKAEIE